MYYFLYFASEVDRSLLPMKAIYHLDDTSFSGVIKDKVTVFKYYQQIDLYYFWLKK